MPDFLSHSLTHSINQSINPRVVAVVLGQHNLCCFNLMYSHISILNTRGLRKELLQQRSPTACFLREGVVACTSNVGVVIQMCFSIYRLNWWKVECDRITQPPPPTTKQTPPPSRRVWSFDVKLFFNIIWYRRCSDRPSTKRVCTLLP